MHEKITYFRPASGDVQHVIRALRSMQNENNVRAYASVLSSDGAAAKALQSEMLATNIYLAEVIFIKVRVGFFSSDTSAVR